MTDITKLPDKWCEPAPFMDGAGALSLGYNKGRRDCAMDIISALPKWTKLTDDPETWPDDDAQVLVSEEPLKDSAIMPESMSGWMAVDGYQTEWVAWWRPLCDLDRPPEDKT